MASNAVNRRNFLLSVPVLFVLDPLHRAEAVIARNWTDVEVRGDPDTVRMLLLAYYRHLPLEQKRGKSCHIHYRTEAVCLLTDGYAARVAFVRALRAVPQVKCVVPYGYTFRPEWGRSWA